MKKKSHIVRQGLSYLLITTQILHTPLALAADFYRIDQQCPTRILVGPQRVLEEQSDHELRRQSQELRTLRLTESQQNDLIKKFEEAQLRAQQQIEGAELNARLQHVLQLAPYAHVECSGYLINKLSDLGVVVDVPKHSKLLINANGHLDMPALQNLGLVESVGTGQSKLKIKHLIGHDEKALLGKMHIANFKQLTFENTAVSTLQNLILENVTSTHIDGAMFLEHLSIHHREFKKLTIGDEARFTLMGSMNVKTGGFFITGSKLYAPNAAFDINSQKFEWDLKQAELGKLTCSAKTKFGRDSETERMQLTVHKGVAFSSKTSDGDSSVVLPRRLTLTTPSLAITNATDIKLYAGLPTIQYLSLVARGSAIIGSPTLGTELRELNEVMIDSDHLDLRSNIYADVLYAKSRLLANAPEHKIRAKKLSLEAYYAKLQASNLSSEDGTMSFHVATLDGLRMNGNFCAKGKSHTLTNTHASGRYIAGVQTTELSGENTFGSLVNAGGLKFAPGSRTHTDSLSTAQDATYFDQARTADIATAQNMVILKLRDFLRSYDGIYHRLLTTNFKKPLAVLEASAPYVHVSGSVVESLLVNSESALVEGTRVNKHTEIAATHMATLTHSTLNQSTIVTGQKKVDISHTKCLLDYGDSIHVSGKEVQQFDSEVKGPGTAIMIGEKINQQRNILQDVQIVRNEAGGHLIQIGNNSTATVSIQNRAKTIESKDCETSSPDTVLSAEESIRSKNDTFGNTVSMTAPSIETKNTKLDNAKKVKVEGDRVNVEMIGNVESLAVEGRQTLEGAVDITVERECSFKGPHQNVKGMIRLPEFVSFDEGTTIAKMFKFSNQENEQTFYEERVEGTDNQCGFFVLNTNRQEAVRLLLTTQNPIVHKIVASEITKLLLYSLYEGENYEILFRNRDDLLQMRSEYFIVGQKIDDKVRQLNELLHVEKSAKDLATEEITVDNLPALELREQLKAFMDQQQTVLHTLEEICSDRDFLHNYVTQIVGQAGYMLETEQQFGEGLTLTIMDAIALLKGYQLKVYRQKAGLHPNESKNLECIHAGELSQLGLTEVLPTRHVVFTSFNETKPSVLNHYNILVPSENILEKYNPSLDFDTGKHGTLNITGLKTREQGLLSMTAGEIALTHEELEAKRIKVNKPFFSTNAVMDFAEKLTRASNIHIVAKELDLAVKDKVWPKHLRTVEVNSANVQGCLSSEGNIGIISVGNIVVDAATIVGNGIDLESEAGSILLNQALIQMINKIHLKAKYDIIQQAQLSAGDYVKESAGRNIEIMRGSKMQGGTGMGNIKQTLVMKTGPDGKPIVDPSGHAETTIQDQPVAIDLSANGQINAQAAHLNAIGGINISGAQGVRFSPYIRYEVQVHRKTRGWPVRTTTTHTIIIPHVEKSSISSLVGTANISSTDGSIHLHGTDTVALGGILNMAKGDVIHQDVVVSRSESVSKSSSLWDVPFVRLGSSHSAQTTMRNTPSHLLTHRNIFIVSQEGHVKSSGQIYVAPEGMVVQAKKGIEFSLPILEDYMVCKKQGFSVSNPILDAALAISRGESIGQCLSHLEPLVAHARTIEQTQKHRSHSQVKAALAVLDAVQAFRSSGNLQDFVTNRIGLTSTGKDGKTQFDPKLQVGYSASSCEQRQQHLGQGGIYVGLLYLLSPEGNIVLKNAIPVNVQGDAYIHAKTLSLLGAALNSSMKFTQKGVSCSGSAKSKNVSVGYSQSDSSFDAVNMVNLPMYVDGKLTLNVDTMTLKAANLDVGSIAGHVKNLHIESVADETKQSSSSFSGSVGSGDGGWSASAAVSSANGESSKVAVASGIHVRTDVNANNVGLPEFVIAELLSMAGSYFTSDGSLKFNPKKIIARDIEEKESYESTSVGGSASMGGNGYLECTNDTKDYTAILRCCISGAKGTDLGQAHISGIILDKKSQMRHVIRDDESSTGVILPWVSEEQFQTVFGASKAEVIQQQEELQKQREAENRKKEEQKKSVAQEEKELKQKKQFYVSRSKEQKREALKKMPQKNETLCAKTSQQTALKKFCDSLDISRFTNPYNRDPKPSLLKNAVSRQVAVSAPIASSRQHELKVSSHLRTQEIVHPTSRITGSRQQTLRTETTPRTKGSDNPKLLPTVFGQYMWAFAVTKIQDDQKKARDLAMCYENNDADSPGVTTRFSAFIEPHLTAYGEQDPREILNNASVEKIAAIIGGESYTNYLLESGNEDWGTACARNARAVWTGLEVASFAMPLVQGYLLTMRGLNLARRAYMTEGLGLWGAALTAGRFGIVEASTEGLKQLRDFGAEKILYHHLAPFIEDQNSRENVAKFIVSAFRLTSYGRKLDNNVKLNLDDIVTKIAQRTKTEQGRALALATNCNFSLTKPAEFIERQLLTHPEFPQILLQRADDLQKNIDTVKEVKKWLKVIVTG